MSICFVVHLVPDQTTGEETGAMPVPGLDAPSVDIIIAARNEAAHLGACLDAIQRQDYRRDSVSIYVADNGSTDDTARVAHSYGVHVVDVPVGNAASARNAATRSGNGSLVGFLDAHCIAPANWLQLMTAQLTEPEIAGAGGPFDFRFADPFAGKIFSASALAERQSFYRHTVGGATSPFPWIPSGNVIYRRSALARAGLFDEKLVALEDVDLSWRLVLSGYRFAFADQASVVHMDDASAVDMIRKFFNYGRGAAVLASIHSVNFSNEKTMTERCASKCFITSDPSTAHSLFYPVARLIARVAYGAGAWSALTLNIESSFDVQRIRPAAKFRKSFTWGDKTLQVSPNCVFWKREEEFVVAVVLGTGLRLLFQDSSNIIFRCLISGCSPDETLKIMCDEFDEEETQIREDLSSFVDELITLGVLISACPSPMDSTDLLW